MSDNNTRPAAGPMYYDHGEFIHACESSFVNGGIRLVWTKCDMDVPENQGFIQGEGPAITCPECLKAVAQGQPG